MSTIELTIKIDTTKEDIGDFISFMTDYVRNREEDNNIMREHLKKSEKQKE